MLTEKNTVLLPLEDYNDLRDFKQNLEKNNSARITGGRYSGGNSYTFVSTEETVKLATKFNDELIKENNELRSKVSELQTLKDLPKPAPVPLNTYQLNELKNMTIWEFRKWKKQK
jgi:hypothetical protein